MAKNATSTQRLSFEGALGDALQARLELPTGPIRATAIFAHCFTCSKDIFAAKHIATQLASKGFAVMRFDFTGLGTSEGDFADTNFSSNIDDLVRAADTLREAIAGPSLLVGHSLGGAAVLAAAAKIPEVQAVATIGAPADVNHIEHSFKCQLNEIEANGEAEVSLAGRPFTIKKQFLEDLDQHSLADQIGNMNKALMVLHSPIDDTVGIENAAEIFTAAKHPKSFVSLDTADHLLTNKDDAIYAAEVITAWAARFVEGGHEPQADVPLGALVAETGLGKFQNFVRVGHHTLLADEPRSVGGLDTGPTPYDYLATALGACTTMTLRMYADFKKLPVEHISTEVLHNKVHGSDCKECSTDDLEGKANSKGKIDRFERLISLKGNLSQKDREALLRIADKCPVHQTMEHGSVVVSKLVE
ncbi:bifunctional alpha/beta hydrolase/OsmC family protein [Cohaesibacter celericrescens]|uniref:Osmotically inducible protein C n=1 Tax=Cohaesibacter celericrescens TaxID=2067669 RepID=A0A2N5XR01_9HYPH|nr:bifunctional alpha/beta hydrolase/OsmC family protein [Cohaesibacter celericrescens]PLW76941.1 osmotically inducible protein C [Cohaesibacter celericrescens]